MALVGAVIAAALLYVLAFPPFSQSWLAWLALAPLYCALRSGGAARAAVLGGAWAALSTLGLVAWLLPTIHATGESWPASATLWASYGVIAAAPYFGAAFAVCGVARPPASNTHLAAVVARPLLFAMAWVAAEAGRTYLGIRSPWGLLGETQAGFAQLRQLAEFSGVYGVSFVVAWVNAAVGEAVCCVRGVEPEAAPALDEPPVDPVHLGRETAVVALVPALLTLVIAVTHGSFRLDPYAWRTASIRGAVIQPNVPSRLAAPAHGGDRAATARAENAQAVERYRALVEEALRPSHGASAPAILLLPENALPGPLRNPLDLASVSTLARSGTPVLVGVERITSGPTGEGRRTGVALVRPGGEVEHYDKQRLLPFQAQAPGRWAAALGPFGWQPRLRVFEAGRQPGLFSIESPKAGVPFGVQLGVLVGSEALHPDLARDAAARGAALLVNAADDSQFHGRGAREQHLAQVVFRAVETGLPVVRSSATGISAVISPTGEVVSQAPLDEPAVMRFHVSVDPQPLAGATAYTLFGDVFVAGCGLALLGVAAARMTRRRMANLAAAERNALGVPG